jgi:outer membrane protein OmpA-like peptidoglycan-associated protein
MHMTPQNSLARTRLPRFFLRSLLLAALLIISGCLAKPDLTRQTEALTSLGFKKIGDTWKLTLPDRVLFEFDKASLKPELRHSIVEVADQLLFVNIVRVRVEGHTDNVGVSEYNKDLSLRRANTVAAVLVTEGFSAANLESVGYGADRPVADNSSEEGRAQNRRVEIIVLSDMLAAP